MLNDIVRVEGEREEEKEEEEEEEMSYSHTLLNSLCGLTDCK